MASSAPGSAEAPRPSGYIVGPLFDCVFFLYAPLLALVLGILVAHSDFGRKTVTLFGREVYPSSVFIGSFISAHLLIVVLRSHGNPTVFRRHPWRFTLVPALLFAAVYASLWLSVAVGVLAIWWDVYHSSMQTFGLGRLYDQRAGNDPQAGRWLDIGVNLLLYVGPILGGVTLVNHLKFFESFEQVDSPFFAAIPARVDPYRGLLTWGVLALGTPYLIYYLYAYWRLARRGYHVSPQKVLLLASTGFCSIYTWGFNTFGEAFFIMNFFHAWQYFAIVWWSEGRRLRGWLKLEARARRPLALALFVLLPLAYGFLVTAVPLRHGALFCLALVVSIMHFWYDGFIWSVRQGHV